MKIDAAAGIYQKSLSIIGSLYEQAAHGICIFNSSMFIGIYYPQRAFLTMELRITIFFSILPNFNNDSKLTMLLILQPIFAKRAL